MSLAPTGHCDGPSGRAGDLCLEAASACPISYNSVCGCGGRTYSNERQGLPVCGRSPLTTSSRTTASVRKFADVPSGATADSATVSPPGSWTEPPVLTSYSDEAGAQEAKARDSIVERPGRVVSLEVSRG